MRVLQIMSSVSVGLGGVLEGVRMLSEEWISAGHQVEIATLDPPGFADAAAFPVTVHTLGPSFSKWAYSPAFYPWLRDHHSEYDIIVVHGLWQYHTYASWRALHGQPTPYVAFTHGMLDPYFRKRFPFKHLKKWLVWPWSDYRLLRDAKSVMFTCEEEKELARKSFPLYKANEKVVGYGTESSPYPLDAAKEAFLYHFPQLRGRRLLTFMGRLNPKKACDILIEAFAHTLAKDPQWHLLMAGPDLDGWEKDLRKIARQLKIEDRITWAGMLRNELKWGSIAASELLILPSHQENFGVVIAEALSCGVPVILSDRVNIWREISASGAGLVTKNTRAGIEQSLLKWQNSTTEEKQKMRDNTVPCFRKYFDIHTVSLNLLETLGETAESPSMQHAVVPNGR